ncbi:MAG: hypothetical protein QOK03_1799 [Candidatus Binataceae bacterium]|nr:hypothetical protein [Candidatus Binataceae bacterium]
MAMEILAKRALNLAALFLVLIVCPESIRAQPVVTAGSRLSDTFAASTPVMNTAREAATATLLRNGKVLIAGGSDGSISLSCTELYDPTTNTFAKSTPLMNVARDNATATLLRDGRVLIAGGGGVSASLSSAELYDPATNTFAPSASTPVMNIARAAATATVLRNGKVLIAGGYGNSSPYFLDSTEVYDPATNTFAPSASTPVMNTARYFATATLLSKGKVLIAGGINGGTSLRSTELYNWATNTFTASTSTPVMNSPRQYATATLMRNGKVLIGGGEVIFEDVLNSTELYDAATNTFAASTSTPMMNAGRIFATATLLRNGKVLIAGGQDLVSSHLYNSLSSTDLYDPNTNTFAPATLTPVMNTARDLATATALRNGKVLIAGGESFVGAPPGTTILSSTELYSPGRPR